MKKDEKKISQNRQKKEVIIAEISDKVAKAKAIVFTDYEGMTHHQLEGFKKDLKKVDAELAVTKNTLLSRALQQLNLDNDKLKFDRPTATLFAYNDPIGPLKELTKLIKTLQKPAIKRGIFEGKIVEEQELKTLSTLPSREVLLGQLVGTLKSPIYGLHRSLSWNLQKFVMTLKAIETQKQ